jgi:hypothetical protein
MGDIIGLDLLAIKAYVEACGIEWNEDLLRRLSHLEALLLNHYRKAQQEQENVSNNRKHSSKP